MAMQVQLKRTGNLKFEATGAAGVSMVIDGPTSSGGTEQGMRPMESVLVALASCSAMDVVGILKKQRQDLKDLDITVHGERADAIPSVFTAIRVEFEASGTVELEKLQKAVELSIEKYCSVAAMLRPTVSIQYECRVR